MFASLLIANRGEIACRIVRTGRRLGIRTITVYSDADAEAPHVAQADMALRIGPPPARQSYLDIDAILEAARRAGAHAIHPGYGFLSENADFAEACLEAGLVFVGPPPEAIRAMGSKAAAKALMARAGVPVVPGFYGSDQDLATLTKAAAEVGYPVLIKASAGGGGKGMRIVEREAALGPALESAAREAAASFGDARLLIEKYLTRPRHIEIQIFADTHGNTVSLFERDCSIQRRHQKVVEEAPAPGLSEARRQAMGEAAIAAARAAGYVGAGTVEFIAEDDKFYFMEMNTRLQVEHPVTEMVTGLDLVEWQLRVAAGEKLPPAPRAPTGHAIEVRLYAEDPSRDFLPATGEIRHLRFPPQQAGRVRIDAGVRSGSQVTPFYDPMLAKLIVHGDNREIALGRLRSALSETELVGIETNLPLLRAIADHPDFSAGSVDTGFISRHGTALQAPAAPPPREAWAAAVLLCLDDPAPAHPGDPFSPWTMRDSWRLNGSGHQDVWLAPKEGDPVAIRAWHGEPATRLELPDGAGLAILAPEQDGRRRIQLDGVSRPVTLVRAGEEIVVVLDGANHLFRHHDPLAPQAAETAAALRVTAPIPARVTRILAVAGEKVEKGAPLLILEAMKMELTLTAPLDGIVAEIRPRLGDMVEEGTDLVRFAEAD